MANIERDLAESNRDDENTDTILLNALEDTGAFVVADESGNFAVCSPTVTPDRPGYDADVCVRVPAEAWRSSLREAIQAFIEEDRI